MIKNKFHTPRDFLKHGLNEKSTKKGVIYIIVSILLFVFKEQLFELGCNVIKSMGNIVLSTKFADAIIPTLVGVVGTYLLAKKEKK